MPSDEFEFGWTEPAPARRLIEALDDPYRLWRMVAVRSLLGLALGAFASFLFVRFDVLQGLVPREWWVFGLALFVAAIMGALSAFEEGPETTWVVLGEPGIRCGVPNTASRSEWGWEDIGRLSFGPLERGRVRSRVLLVHLRDGTTHPLGLSEESEEALVAWTTSHRPAVLVDRDAADFARCLSSRRGRRTGKPTAPARGPDLGRREPALVFLFGLVGGGVNVLLALAGWWYLPVLVLLAVPALLLGLVGLAWPMIFWATRPSNKHLYPAWAHRVGHGLLTFGLVLGAVLMFAL